MSEVKQTYTTFSSCDVSELLSEGIDLHISSSPKGNPFRVIHNGKLEFSQPFILNLTLRDTKTENAPVVFSCQGYTVDELMDAIYKLYLHPNDFNIEGGELI